MSLVLDRQAVVKQAREWESQGETVVFTNGCFDILHRGHVDYLEQAAQLGATLLVAVNSDGSIRALGKGEDRPINSLADRLAVLAALRPGDRIRGGDAAGTDSPVPTGLAGQRR